MFLLKSHLMLLENVRWKKSLKIFYFIFLAKDIQSMVKNFGIFNMSGNFYCLEISSNKCWLNIYSRFLYFSEIMAGLPRVSSLLKKGAATPSLRNLSFTVAGQGDAKVKVRFLYSMSVINSTDFLVASHCTGGGGYLSKKFYVCSSQFED